MIIVKIGGGSNINVQGIIADLATITERFLIVHGANALRDKLAKDLGQPKQVLTSVKGYASVYSDEKLLDVKTETGSVINYRPAKRLENKELFELNVDIIVPAALPDVINAANVERVKAKMVVEAANLPVRPEIEKVLANKGVMVVPDILANAGGVISSYAEYRGYNPKRMLEMVQRKIRQNTVKVIETALDNNIALRDAAMNIAKERITKANRH